MKTEEDNYLFFARYLAQETDEKENEVFYHWLQASPEHLSQFLACKKIWDHAGPDEEQSTAQSYTSLQQQIRRRQKRRYFGWGTAAAVACGFLCWIFSSLLYSEIRVNELYESTVVTQRAQRRHVVLPDRTSVWLNADSRLSYNSWENKNRREVYLTGEAYFEVAKDSLRPFVVKVKDFDVKVLGTKFNINAYEEEKYAATTVQEGHVAVVRKEKEVFHLLKNDRVAFNREQKRFKKGQVNAATYSSWREGRLCFREESFPDLIKTLERYFDVDISLEDEKLADYVFTGTFETGMKPGEILHILQQTSPFHFTIKENHITIDAYEKIIH